MHEQHYIEVRAHWGLAFSPVESWLFRVGAQNEKVCTIISILKVSVTLGIFFIFFASC